MNKLVLIVYTLCLLSAYPSKGQPLLESSDYSLPIRALVDGDSQFFAISDFSMEFIDAQYGHRKVYNSASYPYQFGFNPSNMKGFLNDHTVRLYSEDNLSYYACGDVGFQSFLVATYNIDTNGWQYTLIECSNWWGIDNDDSLCTLLQGFSAHDFQLAQINATDVFVLFQQEFIRINDTIPENKISRPLRNAPALFPSLPDQKNFKITHGVALDSALILFSNKATFKYDLQGNFISHTDTSHPSFNQIITKVYKLNDSIALYAQPPKLYSINSDLDASLMFDYGTYLNELISVKNTGGNWWLLGTSPVSNSIRLLQIDSSMNLLSTYEFYLDEVTPQAFRIDGSQLFITGTEKISPIRNNTAFVTKIYNLQQLQDSFHNDAYIDDYSLDVFYALEVFPMVFVSSYKHIIANLSFSVFNNGSDTLKSVVVQADFRESVYTGCHAYYPFVKELNDINIPPQTAQSFSFDSIGINTSTNDDLDFCIWTITPNRKIDKNHENDAICQRHVIISAKELDNNQSLKVYPNPAENVLYVHTLDIPGEQEISIRLFSSQGEELIRRNVHSGDISEISLKNFPQGIYLLQSMIGTEIISQKIVKD